MRKGFFAAIWFLIGAVASLPSVAALPNPASPARREWNELFTLVTWIAIVVAVVVWTILIYALVRFRRRKGQKGHAPHIHGNTRMEIAWTIAPILVFGWLLLLSYNALFSVTEYPTEPVDFEVEVEAYRFGWTFTYPDGTQSTNGTLRVEQNRVITLGVTSPDVIHAYSVQELGVMIDAVPGRTNTAWFKAEIPGEYDIKCRELCGLGHSLMLGTVVVFPEGSEGSRHWGYEEEPPGPTDGTGDQDVEGRGIPIELGPDGRLAFDPSAVDADPGETVTFLVENVDPFTSHNLFAGERDTSAPNEGAQWFSPTLQPGETAQVSITFPDDDQTILYWCQVPGHFQGGMRGQITVGEGGELVEEEPPLLPGFEALGVLVAIGVALALGRRR